MSPRRETCANSKVAAPRGPWKPYVDSTDAIHYAERHTRTYNVLYCDGHVVNQRKTDLADQLFYIDK
ncbi:MAG TPA: hypothetical protein VKE94_20270 [Gemmataceae bacterium]|nr:hypothetical protein [Gemmataceae bacterium]